MQKLWDERVLPILPTQQLLHLHRELCRLRGKSLGKGNPVYVWRSPFRMLYLYHLKVIAEMRARKWKPSASWENILYRGKSCDTMSDEQMFPALGLLKRYAEHDDAHFQACLDRIKSMKKSAKDELRIKTMLGNI